MNSEDYYFKAVFEAYARSLEACMGGQIDVSKVKEFAVELLNNMWTNIDEAKKRSIGK